LARSVAGFAPDRVTTGDGRQRNLGRLRGAGRPLE
jgi:hypothetical protein